MKTPLPRLTGMGMAATLALALLALGCVFAALAGPREALADRTQALRQTLTATSPLSQAIVVSGDYNGISSAMQMQSFNGQPPASSNLTQAQFGEVTSQLHGDFSHSGITLAPTSQDWASMISGPHDVASPVPAADGVAVRLEVGYREPFTSYMRLVAGSYPGAQPPATPPAPGKSKKQQVPVLNLQVVVSQQTARQFGLHPGSKLKINGPQIALSGQLAEIELDVTGIVAPRNPESTFWTADPTALTPSLQTPIQAPPYWVGEMLVGPGEIDEIQTYFGPEGLSMTWEIPFEVSALTGNQAQPLYNALNKLDSQTPQTSGDVAPVGGTLSVNNGLLLPLSEFIATAAAVDTLLWLLYVSLAVAGVVTLVLTARMVVMRRSAELTMRRARGASLRQIFLTVARGAAIACVPAAAVAAVFAIRLVAGPVLVSGWWPPAAALLAAVCAPAAIAVWQQRLPRRRSRERRRPRARTRLVAEATAVAAAIAGIIVFRQQGTQAGAGVNLYTSAAPVLIAVPAVIVVLRVYPLVLRGLLRGSAQRAGATAFLGLARAARTALTPALPAFALVLALTVAAFAGMVRDAVSSGEVTASWQAAGADVTVNTSGPLSSGAPVTPAVLRAVAAVPGVTHATAVWQSAWTAPNDQQITGIAVEPASYAALVSGTQTFPQVQARFLAVGTPQPVVASAQALADIGNAGFGTLTAQSGVAPVRVWVDGVLSATPAAPGAAAFVIMPVTAIHGFTGPLPLNELLITGTSIDMARLSAVVRKMLPGAATTLRSDILKDLSGAPLQHGTFVLFELSIAVAAALGLAVMLLELALGAAERDTTLARLAAMGLGEGQRARVVTLEVLPALIAAAVAAAACALILPPVVRPAIDLSAFTGSPGAVALAPDVSSFAVPIAGLAVLAVVALGVEIRSGRRRGGAAGNLRAGE
jgi:putative ABC transport system permease protein